MRRQVDAEVVLLPGQQRAFRQRGRVVQVEARRRRRLGRPEKAELADPGGPLSRLAKRHRPVERREHRRARAEVVAGASLDQALQHALIELVAVNGGA